MPAGYYPKFGGFLAAIISQKGVAEDVDELSTISVKFWTMPRENWLVCERRKVDEWKGTDPCSSPTKGKLVGD